MAWGPILNKKGGKGAGQAPVVMKNERVEGLLDKLIDMFRSGSLPPTVARTVIRKNKNDISPNDNWTIGNRILMMMQGSDDARGYKQWKQVGRFVKKGAKAIYILAPVTRTITETKTDPDTDEEREEKRTIIIGFRDIPVFGYEDTEGDPLPEKYYDPPQLPPLHEVAKIFGVEVIYAPFDGRSFGFYTWTGGKKIELHTHDIKTWFHELGHAIHSTFKPLKGGQVPEQEIVAELFAAAMCELHGVQGYHQYSWDYIKSYADGDPTKALQAILRILSDVEECFTRVIAVVDLPAMNQVS